MAEKIQLRVVTAEREILTVEADEVQVPALNGYLGILPGHAPLLSEMQMGELSYREGSQWGFLSVFWGFVEVLPDRVVVLAETAERAEEIDLERARIAQQRAEERLQKPIDTDFDLRRAQVALQRALVRQQVAGRRTRIS